MGHSNQTPVLPWGRGGALIDGNSLAGCSSMPCGTGRWRAQALPQRQEAEVERRERPKIIIQSESNNSSKDNSSVWEVPSWTPASSSLIGTDPAASWIMTFNFKSSFDGKERGEKASKQSPVQRRASPCVPIPWSPLPGWRTYRTPGCIDAVDLAHSWVVMLSCSRSMLVAARPPDVPMEKRTFLFQLQSGVLTSSERKS